MSNPKLALIPSGYKSGKVYSILPNDATGDFDFDRASEGTRVRKDGLIEEVTNDVPRLDWLNSNCPSLKLEPQRTNLQVYSEEFDNGVWVKSRTTITANDTISPNGELTADKITGDGTGTSYVYDGISLTYGNTYTISIFVKPIINISSFAINVFGGVGTAYFDLINKTIYTPTGDFTSAKIEDYGNGWLRCSGTLTLSSATGSKNIGYGLIDFNGDQYYLWGAQVEQGDYASSYIKTEASTVTRLKDEILAEDSNLFDITEGTLFVDATPFKSGGGMEIQLSDGTASNRHTIQYQGTGTSVRALTVTGGGTPVFSDFNPLTFDIRNKLAITFKKDEFKFYVNGSLVHTDLLGDVPTGLDKLTFSNPNLTDNFMEGKIHDTRVYDRVLTEAEAIELTT